MSSTVNWLHLSDFHVGLDNHGQTQLFQYILKHVKERIKQSNLDFVFITGDIAQSALDEEYEKFGSDFILPLEEIVGKECKILIVAGNHDVDRNQQKFFDRNAILESTNYFDPTKHGLSDRQNILQRFSSYSKLYQPHINENWIFSEKGCFTCINKIKGINLGILALNTAWICKDGNDKGSLTAGKAIIEKGLEQIESCDVKLVLGHHPINWFHNARPIRSLFAKNEVVYLHGHLHKGSNRYEESAGYQFLSLQSGAAFQGREEDIWINGLLWGKLDFNLGVINLEPRQWHKDNQEWVIDGTAFPDTYHKSGIWELPLPKKTESIPIKTKEKNSFKSPVGWKVIDLEELNKLRSEPDDTTILKYFDGRIPNWALALSKKIPRRQIVLELVNDINNSATIDKRTTINVLLGAGGEGKSTAFLQTIVTLLESNDTWKVLYHEDENSNLSKNIINNLSQEYQWLIASDDADLIAEDFFNVAFSCQSQCNNIHFLLSSRDTDWCSSKIEPSKWENTFNKKYREKRLLGLIQEDANKIVLAWADYQNDGLGKLADLSIEDATQRLLNESKSEVKQEGAFFGALLRVRYGDGLKEHIKKLLNRLKERPISKGHKYTLLDAFSYIAAMHSENQLFLSKLVLAKVLDIELGELRSKVLYPLGEEAAASMAGEYVFTRHRAIAEISMRLIEEEMFYGIESDEVFIELVTIAERLKQSGYFVPNLEKWRYFSDHFMEKNDYSLAINLTKKLLGLDQASPHLRVKLAHQFRKAGHPEQAINVFRNAPMNDYLRGFFSEWGISERNEGNHALSIYLIGYALADESIKKLPSNEDGVICLHGLAESCELFFTNYNKVIFIEALGSAVQLGLSLQGLNKQNTQAFQSLQKIAIKSHIGEVSAHAALRRIQEAITESYKYLEADLPTWLLKPEDLHFNGLKGLLNIR